MSTERKRKEIDFQRNHKGKSAKTSKMKSHVTDIVEERFFFYFFDGEVK